MKNQNTMGIMETCPAGFSAATTMSSSAGITTPAPCVFYPGQAAGSAFVTGNAGGLGSVQYTGTSRVAARAVVLWRRKTRQTRFHPHQ